MTSNEPPPNKNDDGFEQLSFFAAPSSEAKAVEVKQDIAEVMPDAPEVIEAKEVLGESAPESVKISESDKISESVKIPEPAKKSRSKKAAKPDATAATEIKEELAKLPEAAILPSSNANDSRRTVIMNVTEPELKIDFEASLAELETVVKELDGEVKLEKALQLFEQGIKLSVECEQFIKGAESKIEILKKQADGSLATEVFQGERVDLDD